MNESSSVFKTIGSKLLGFIVWVIISLVLSFLMNVVAGHIDGGGFGNTFGVSPHEAAIAPCIVRPESIDVTLRDVGGLAAIKEELQFSLLLPLKYPKIFFQRRGPFAASRGVLLTGPPGCGKTMLMKAVAKTCGCCFLCPSMGTVQSKYYGESQKLVAAMFSVARKKAPCILFFDEVDSAFRTRGEDDSGCDYTLKTEFLSLMDGLRTRGDEGVIVVGATNNPGAIDPALLRRLPCVLRIGLPTAVERRHIVALACRDEPNPAVSAAGFEGLSESDTDGMSGADIAEMYKVASRVRLRRILQASEGVAHTSLATTLTHALPAITTEHWRQALAQLKACKAAASVQHCAAPSAKHRLSALLQEIGSQQKPASM